MRASRLACRLRAHAEWFVYGAVAIACTVYLNARARLVPKWGQWYAADGHPYVLLQLRAFFSGRLALVPNPTGAGNDYAWGVGGMHQLWGLGTPILGIPFHAAARLFGAPGFPDDLRFLIFYAITTFVLARALHRMSPAEPIALVASATAAGFVMVFPTFVGMIASRFQIYEQVIATGALWSVLLLAGILALMQRCSPARLVAVCAAAGFSNMIRIPLAVYGVTTVAIALIIAQRRGVRPRAMGAGVLAFACVELLYFAGNALRFGSPFNWGYATGVNGSFVGRLIRWGLPFQKVPFAVALKEMLVTTFFLPPVSYQLIGTPESLRPYAVGERWREYYCPTYAPLVLAVWLAALGIVVWRVVRHRLWRRDAPLDDERQTVLGAWALPPSFALFVYYVHAGNIVTRYFIDMYPGVAAASLCVGMALVDAVRRRAPSWTSSAQLAIAGGVALHNAGWHGWAEHLSQPVDRKTLLSNIAAIDAHSAEMPAHVPDHLRCDEPRGPPPVHTHLDSWTPDGSFRSVLLFAMPYNRCVSFTFRGGGAWNASDDESLAGFRANGDADELIACGAPAVDGDVRRITMCEPHAPAYLLDGLRLYAIATLDANLNPIDRLKLLRIDGAPSCP